MGSLHYLLGVGVTRSITEGLNLCQRKYILDLLDRCRMTCGKDVHTPMVSSSFLTKSGGTLVKDPSEYRIIAKSL